MIFISILLLCLGEFQSKANSIYHTEGVHEVEFETIKGGESRATSIYNDVTPPEHGFKGPGYTWHSKEGTTLPQSIWYEFPEALTVVKFAFQSRTDNRDHCKGIVRAGASKYEFWGSNDADCSRIEGRVVLYDDKSGTAFTRQNIPKIGQVKSPISCRCYGFTIKASAVDNLFASMSNIRLWYNTEPPCLDDDGATVAEDDPGFIVSSEVAEDDAGVAIAGSGGDIAISGGGGAIANSGAGSLGDAVAGDDAGVAIPGGGGSIANDAGATSAGGGGSIANDAGATISGGGGYNASDAGVTSAGGGGSLANDAGATSTGGGGYNASDAGATSAGGGGSIANDARATSTGGGGSIANDARATSTGVGGYNASDAGATSAGAGGSIANDAGATSEGVGGYNASDAGATSAGGGGSIANDAGATSTGGGGSIANDARATIAGDGGYNASNAGATSAGVVGSIANDAGATITGGGGYNASDAGATIAGGGGSIANDAGATIAGGVGAVANDAGATIAGGGRYNASDAGATSAGGGGSIANDEGATIAGGVGAVANDAGATIAGGGGYNVSDAGVASAGGGGSIANDAGATSTGGGGYNASDAGATSAGVGGSIANDAGATITGGGGYNANDAGSTIAGGGGYNASDAGATNAGGGGSIASDEGAAIAGGGGAVASDAGAAITGDGGSIASDAGVAIAGGGGAIASNAGIAIAGGGGAIAVSGAGSLAITGVDSNACKKLMDDCSNPTVKKLCPHMCLEGYLTATACENKDLNIKCDNGLVIHVVEANYGRTNINICNDKAIQTWSSDCHSKKSYPVLTDRCNSKASCDVAATNAIFGDPCDGVEKYLEVHYTCDSDTCSSHGGKWITGQCLIIHEQAMTWDQAASSCEANNLRLAVPRDPVEFSTYLTTHHAGKRIWLGGSDRDHEGTWTWVSGQTFTGFPWQPGEPNDAGGNEDCLEWGYRNNYNDHVCTVAKHYICEYVSCALLGGVSVTGQCFTFHEEPKTWDQAVSSCESKKLQLAVLQDPAAFNTYLQTHHAGKVFWLGARDQKLEGTWTWINGKNFDGFPWPPGEPNNANNEDCLEWHKKNYNDIACTTTSFYICEYVSCALQGGVTVAGQCFIFYEEPKTWEQAKGSCESKSQRLAVLQDPVGFNTHLQTHHAGKVFWLGARDQTTEGAWTWINGKNFDGFPWPPGEPNNANNEDCLEWRGKNYNDVACTTTSFYICEYVSCALHGGVSVAGQCFIFYEEAKTWDQAKSSCELKSQRLAVLQDPVAANTYLQTHHAGKVFWLGARDQKTEGAWTWINGKNFDGFPWPPGEPNNANNEDCLEWRGKNYNDVACTTTSFYICEYEYESVETVPPPSVSY